MNLKFLIAANQDFPIGFLNSTSFLNQNRCTCQHCQQQTAAEENLCCQAIPAVAEKLDEAEDEPISCITDHPVYICFKFSVTKGKYIKKQFIEMAVANVNEFIQLIIVK